mmetsp:Transcript_12502/g.32901  ORF Transcript_12502/g.32901 Transcript_12502/m.32901 type:complete len:208 (-) Transcript_12502:430-1053(-)
MVRDQASDPARHFSSRSTAPSCETATTRTASSSSSNSLVIEGVNEVAKSWGPSIDAHTSESFPAAARRTSGASSSHTPLKTFRTLFLSSSLSEHLARNAKTGAHKAAAEHFEPKPEASPEGSASADTSFTTLSAVFGALPASNFSSISANDKQALSLTVVSSTRQRASSTGSNNCAASPPPKHVTKLKSRTSAILKWTSSSSPPAET